MNLEEDITDNDEAIRVVEEMLKSELNDANAIRLDVLINLIEKRSILSEMIEIKAKKEY